MRELAKALKYRHRMEVHAACRKWRQLRECLVPVTALPASRLAARHSPIATIAQVSEVALLENHLRKLRMIRRRPKPRWNGHRTKGAQIVSGLRKLAEIPLMAGSAALQAE